MLISRASYFTAPVTRNLETTLGETNRQEVGLNGLKRIENICIIQGVHWREDGKLRKEKMTDVNIALELVFGTMEGGYDAAILLCNDNDQAPAVQAVMQGRCGTPKRVQVWTPFWEYRAFSLRNLDPNPQHVITEDLLAASRLPDVKHMPKEWLAP